MKDKVSPDLVFLPEVPQEFGAVLGNITVGGFNLWEDFQRAVNRSGRGFIDHARHHLNIAYDRAIHNQEIPLLESCNRADKIECCVNWLRAYHILRVNKESGLMVLVSVVQAQTKIMQLALSRFKNL